MRKLVLFMGVLVLSTAVPSPALATTTSVSAFVATMTLNGGLDWACPATTSKCLATVPGANVRSGPKGVPVVDVVPVAGNTRLLSLNTTTCLNHTANVAKLSKPLTTPPGLCALAASGSITGFCNLATGTMTTAFTDSLGQSFTLTITFTWAGPSGIPFDFLAATPAPMTITGTARKVSNGRTGWVVGSGAAVALPPIVGSNSCFTKTARIFTITGELAVVVKNT